MEGTIFLRGNQVTEQEEEILEAFKSKKNINFNTTAIRSIIVEYDRLDKRNEQLREDNKQLAEQNEKLERELAGHREFFRLFNQLSKTSDHE
ncbi:MAG: hypothetical protein E6Q35_07255 [Chryseobacterium cucumeris]|nr:MAG: hypothetical protein E6Q35_07255 [Chryseobacterium cucumeris]